MKLALLLLISATVAGQQDSIKLIRDHKIRYKNFYRTIDSSERNKLLYDAVAKPEKYENLPSEMIKIDNLLIQQNVKLLQSVHYFETTFQVKAKQVALPTIIDDELEDDKIYEDPLELKKRGKRLTGQTKYDSRVEMHQLNPALPWQAAVLKNCESVGIIVEKNKLAQLTSQFYYLTTTTTLGSYFRLCPNEPFYNQPILGGGTAFIVSGDTMITARHVFMKPLSEYVIVFGYRLLYANGVVENFFPKDNVYSPVSFLNNYPNIDVVEFKVDRKLNRPALTLGDSSSMKNKAEIYMIGHPCGLPLKIAANASIAEGQALHYFYTTLDSFMGNSGSPVFDGATHNVIGILVSGEIDFSFNGNCYTSPLCSLPQCRGEKVVRIEALRKRP